MSLVQLYIPMEVAQPTVTRLGEQGQLQFRDLNPKVNAFQRAFVGEVRRLDEMERKLRFLAAQTEKAEIPVRPVPEHGDLLSRPRTTQQMDELESAINAHEARVLQLNNSHEALLRRSLELTEMKHVLHETASFFSAAEGRGEDLRRASSAGAGTGVNDSLLQSHYHMEEGGGPASGPATSSLTLGFVAGVIGRSKVPTLERVLWRALRGNLYLNYADIPESVIDPSTDEVVDKSVFVVFAHGREILAKSRKLAESLGATLYPVDGDVAARRESALAVVSRLEDLNAVLYNTNRTRKAELASVAEHLAVWLTIVRKEKAVYHTMNLFNYDRNRKCLIAEAWCPTLDIPNVQGILRSSSSPGFEEGTNKFTAGFQGIIDAYGVAKYGEVNPGLFTVITFPFLFAVMFGDIGHGILMASAAGYLCWKEKGLAKFDGGEIFDMMFGGRYIILLMGLFSIYTGAIYNDIFSQSMHIFHSGWEYRDVQANQTTSAHQVGIYPFGLDPAWHGTENMLIFSNSYKMKMAVLFGVAQMTFGICLQLWNFTHFKKRISILAEFVPQMIFMQAIFGYLCVTILYKWSVDWSTTDAAAPNLLNMLIFMFLSPGNVSEPLYAGQSLVQQILLLVAFICIPWMLLMKPLILKREHAAKVEAASHSRDSLDSAGPTDPNTSSASSHEEDPAAGVIASAGEGGEFNFGDIMIYQIIHTIEFCLGCISNTASYLRLWALSLAHAQLSAVLWDMTLASCFAMSPSAMPVGLVIGFAAWFIMTISVMLIMEGLSAFLHALRLHWMEFDNKFYEGSGKAFMPFAFRTILDDNAEE
ncbi:V-type ATPase, V0 complex, 116kDa subunit family [Piptocephalis cylindrospora]|uniref:V-type proton ATPase subunit a n=1 Tax=Piptocephalis cylindrospora TaxID=1907219 RepID=A0A4P9Y8M9_9FUNG|nr:V-type ATPase, V0 complex, 116kDa subunit family [Piptocephalis cylindrospora]|eukprot:RKP15458.1 V-type ATPase, V0 complex, 116kDa subunit family [Piptocephalis cylindrospora]